ncbi:hypothetical protein OB919_05595 [Halobacteria archaeon AArc-curdl1]|uniref:Uncharacterized protein n=1 Tax=Natronosalvus hydrolyticus TaxID=2979988 RepID=A0AAP2Z7A6_9EURY|nr:hypothetical protein [Halobacteria archaeon AArc-curdl1]
MSKGGCKVCRVRRAYDLSTLDETLLERWQRDEDRYGYRRLATYINASILETELERAGLYTPETAATALYEGLANDDPAVREQLEREELPLERLESDFVSFGVVRTHLQECLNAEWSGRERTTDWEQTTLETVVPRLLDRTHRALESLQRREELELPEAIELSMTVSCSSCGESASLESLLAEDAWCACLENREAESDDRQDTGGSNDNAGEKSNVATDERRSE